MQSISYSVFWVQSFKYFSDINQQLHLFDLDSDVTYLNCGAYSPFLKSVKNAGIEAIGIKSNPQNIVPKELFFDKCDQVRKLVQKLLNAPHYQDIALIPSVSYGMAIVANNVFRIPNLSLKKNIIIVGEEFPNNLYTFEKACQKNDLRLISIDADPYIEDWNTLVLNAISSETALIVLPHVHWIYGYKFDLEAISSKCKECACLLIIDGTQSVGALPLDIEKIKPNAIIGGCYKWLMGPYSSAYAYFDEFFHEGEPIEESWMNRENAHDFVGLLAYNRTYAPRAQRYNVGEFSQFINTPMVIAALNQILEWGVQNIQDYIYEITKNPIKKLKDLGCQIIDERYRASHLFGVILPVDIDSVNFQAELAKEKIHISLRGKAVRISPHVYNSEEDLLKLCNVIERLKK